MMLGVRLGPQAYIGGLVQLVFEQTREFGANFDAAAVAPSALWRATPKQAR